MKLPRLTIQLKPVGNNCNLGCEYCYAMPFRTEGFNIMPKELLEKIVKEAFEVTDAVIVSWHGGEPTMPGVEFYRDYMNLVNKYKKEGQTIVNMIQTNATLIDEEFAEFFKENNFIVSVSIDGNEETHNKNRHYSCGKSSYQQTMKGVENLRKYGINPPVIATVCQNTYEDCENTFYSFIENGFKEIKFSPVYDSAEDSFSISCEKWFEYLKKITDMWIDMQDDTIKIREVDEVLKWFTGETINTCSSTNSCINWISINEFGDMYPCEYLRATESYGNLKEIGIADVFNTSAYARFLSKLHYIPKECKECSFYDKCGNGCPATRIRNQILSYDGVYVYCEQRQMLYNYIKDILESEDE